MMNRPNINLLCGIGFVLAVLLAGCQSSVKQQSADAATDSKAAMCTKCERIWVRKRLPDDPIAQTTIYLAKQAMQCPDCDVAMDRFFETGILPHSCKSCGGALKHCAITPN